MKFRHCLMVLAGLFFLLASGTVRAQTTGTAMGVGAAPTAILPVSTNNQAAADISAGLKSQLTAAGYQKAEKINGAAGKFMPPLYYFRVQSTSTNAVWGDVANVVSVFIYKTADITFVYNNGAAEIIDMNGRTQVRTSNPGQYIVVTGPDRDKAVLLAHNLKVLQ